ncbi:MAG: hypothetical protein AAF902_18860, partial [Chloroflexota bacterium]
KNCSHYTIGSVKSLLRPRSPHRCWQIGKVTNIRSPWLSNLRNTALSLAPASVGDRGRSKLFTLPIV